jgi:hypothetical protein
MTITIQPESTTSTNLNIYADGRRVARSDVFRRRRALYLVGDDSQNYGAAISAKDATPAKLARTPRAILGMLGECGLDLPESTVVVYDRG